MIQFYWSLHNSGNQRHYNSFSSDPECTKYFIIYLLLKDEVSPRESSQWRRLPLVEQIAGKLMRWHLVTAKKREWERSVSSVFIALCLTFIAYLDGLRHRLAPESSDPKTKPMICLDWGATPTRPTSSCPHSSSFIGSQLVRPKTNGRGRSGANPDGLGCQTKHAVPCISR
jgi:hypothetical protein